MPFWWKIQSKRVIVVADGGDVAEHEVAGAACLVVMLPGDAAVPLVKRDGVGNGHGAAFGIGEHGVEDFAVLGAIHAGLQGDGAESEAEFAGIEAVAEEPAARRVAVGDHHFGERSAIEDGADAAGVFVSDGVEDEAFAGVQRVAEAPLLPADFAVLDAESGAGDLRDGERRGREAQRRVEERREFGGVAGDGDVAIGIEEFEHLAGGEVDVGDQAFDGMRVVVARIAGGVIRDGANHSGLLRAGDVEIPGRPGHDDDVVQIADAAGFHGELPAGIGADDLVGAGGVFDGEHWLRVGDFLQAIDVARVEIGDDFPGAVGIHVVEDGEGAARRLDLAEDHLLGRLVEGDDAEAGGGGDARANEIRGVADFGGAERGERMGGRRRRGAAGCQDGDENDKGGAHLLSGYRSAAELRSD